MATPPARDLWDNPMGTDGFEFVEYTAPDPAALGRAVRAAWASRRSRGIAPRTCSLYRQGDDQLHRQRRAGQLRAGASRACTGPAICAIAFRVKDAALRLQARASLGAWGVEAQVGPMELNIPAIKGIGDSLIYLVDRYGDGAAGVSIYDVDFVPLPGRRAASAAASASPTSTT